MFKQKSKEAKILIIDDDKISIELLEDILQTDVNNKIYGISDTRSFVDTFIKIDPDIIILDFEMPYYNGFEIYNQIQSFAKKNLPVIMITVNDDIKVREKAYYLGIENFIHKPFIHNEILSIVKNQLNKCHAFSMLIDRAEGLNKKLITEKKHGSEMQMELIECLLKAIESRDQETGDHVNRIRNLVYTISKRLGCTEKQANDFANASKLHDIGKIGISDDILLKKGKLDANEWAEIKLHTLKGAQILQSTNSNILRLASQIARTHHENWDGSGYPLGLSGEQIPLAGRITAVADVFDALISDRPYKKAWDTQRAINHIKDESGTKFDPAVVNAFVKSSFELTYEVEPGL